MMRQTVVGFALGALAALSLAAEPSSGAPQPAPGSSAPAPASPGFQILPCNQGPSAAVLVVPAPFNAFMRVICTNETEALAPLDGYHWVFPNGTNGLLPALNPNMAVTGLGAYFTKLTNAPLTAAQAAAFRAKLKPYMKNPSLMTAEVERLEVDTSTGLHKQEYLLVMHIASGARTGALVVECLSDCNPMDEPWGFDIEPNQQ
jgi:hypothetical protein